MNSIAKAGILSGVVLAVCGLVAFFLFNEGNNLENVDLADVGREMDTEENVADVEDVTPSVSRPAEFRRVEDVSLTVRVTDKSTGTPLPRSSIQVRRAGDGDRPGEQVFDSGRKTRGSSGGRFEVFLPPGHYLVRAQSPSYSSSTVKVVLLKGPGQEVSLELEHGYSISGRILTQSGQSIGEARVMAYPLIGNPRSSMLERLIEISSITTDAQKPPKETTSGADGSYVIDGLERRYYTVKAIATNYSPEERTNILPSKDGVDLKLAAGGELNGVVLEVGDQPVPGAKVSAFTHTESGDIIAIIETRGRPPLETVETTASGAFRFTTLGAGTYNFKVIAPGFQEGEFLRVEVHAGPNPDQRLVLSRGLNIAGTVTSMEGEPVVGAKVKATRASDTTRTQQMFISFDDDSIYTDDQGHFMFNTLKTGSYTILASHEQYASQQQRRVMAGTTDLVLTLPRGGAIEGYITVGGTGEPIVGARISASDLQNLRKEAISDENGYYYVGGMSTSSQGKRYLNVHAEGYARVSNVQVRVQEDLVTSDQNFELDPTAVITGRVVNSSDDPVAGARVMAKRPKTDAGMPITVGSAVTRLDGTFAIEDLEAGEDTMVTVLSAEYLDGQGVNFSVEPGQSLELPDIVLSLGGQVAGEVVDVSGRGLSSVQIQVRLEGETVPDVSLSATSEESGRFLLRGLSAGTVALVAKSPQFIEEVVEGVTVEEGKITSGVRIVVRQGSRVSGIVTDVDGRPVANASVVTKDISVSGGLKELRTESDQNGKFTVLNILSDETVEIEVQHPDYGPWVDEGVKVGSEDLRVELAKLGGITAVVVDDSGNLVPNFNVQPQLKGASASRKRIGAKQFQSNSLNSDGSFEFVGLPPGLYDIHVSAASYSTFTFPNVRVEADVEDLGQAILRLGGRVTGIVSDTRGSPISGAMVRVQGGQARFSPLSPNAGFHSGGSSPTTAVTDGRGFFEFRNLRGGSLSLMVTSKGYINGRVEGIDPNRAGKALDIQIVLDMGGEITGVVVDDTGGAVGGIHVYLTSGGARPNSNQTASTNSEGRFSFEGLSTGSYKVSARRVGRAFAQQMVDVAAGNTHDVQLVFQ